MTTGTVKDLVVGSDVTFDERGAKSLKGVEGTWQVFSVRELNGRALPQPLLPDDAGAIFANSRGANALAPRRTRPVFELWRLQYVNARQFIGSEILGATLRGHIAGRIEYARYGEQFR